MPPGQQAVRFASVEYLNSLEPDMEATELDVEYIDDSAYPRCCCCGRDDRHVRVERDRFMQRDICAECWQAEDDAVGAVAYRSSRC